MVPAPVGYRCPDCARETEARHEGRRVGTVAAWVTITNVAILVMIVVYLAGVARGGGSLLDGPTVRTLRESGDVDVIEVSQGEYWRLLTGMFVHLDLLHLVLNGYALFVVGNLLEAELGRLRYVATFLVVGIFGTAVGYLLTSPVVHDLARGTQVAETSTVLGASGVIFGLFGVFLAYNHRRRSLAYYASRTRQMVVIIAISFLLGFATDGWWQPAVGGLIAGLIVGWCIDGLEDRLSPTASTVLALAALIAASAVIIVVRTGQLVEFSTWVPAD
jgi:membrane associated rhomboid family serine protease